VENAIHHIQQDAILCYRANMEWIPVQAGNDGEKQHGSHSITPTDNIDREPRTTQE